MNKKPVNTQSGEASDSQENKTFRVTLAWDSTEVWEVQAPDEKTAVDDALLGIGELITEPAGYKLQNMIVEEVRL